MQAPGALPDRPGGALLRGWLLLAVGAAGVAGILAVAVAAARIPGARVLSGDSFVTLLVGHVAFSLIVWLLAGVVVVALSATAPRSPGAGWAGLGLAAGGSVLLLWASLAGRGRAVLSDYVPVVDTPAYLGGLALVASGAAAALGSVVRPGPAHRGQPVTGWGAACVAASFGATLLAALGGILRAGHLSTQVMFWGAGHALQYVYAGALAVSWYTLAGAVSGAPPPAEGVSRAAFALYPVLALQGAALYALPDPAALPGLWKVNLVLGAGISVPTIAHLAVVAAAAARRGTVRAAAHTPEVAALVLSVAFYLLGGLLAPVGTRGTLRVTAHYHAVLVGGVTVAFMGMVHHLLDVHGWARGGRRAAAVQLWLFGAGVLATVGVLAWAGALGAPRKMAGSVAASGPWASVMRLMAVAAVPAVLGGALFVALALAALLRASRSSRVLPAPRALAGPLPP